MVRAEAETEGLELATEVADAQPCSDGSFDVVMWTFGAMFALGARHLPSPPGVPPSRWGTEQGLQELLGDSLQLQVRVLSTDFVYPSLDFMLEHDRTWYGPTATHAPYLEVVGTEG